MTIRKRYDIDAVPNTESELTLGTCTTRYQRIDFDPLRVEERCDLLRTHILYQDSTPIGLVDDHAPRAPLDSPIQRGHATKPQRYDRLSLLPQGSIQVDPDHRTGFDPLRSAVLPYSSSRRPTTSLSSPASWASAHVPLDSAHPGGSRWLTSSNRL